VPPGKYTCNETGRPPDGQPPRSLARSLAPALRSARAAARRRGPPCRAPRRAASRRRRPAPSPRRRPGATSSVRCQSSSSSALCLGLAPPARPGFAHQSGVLGLSLHLTLALPCHVKCHEVVHAVHLLPRLACCVTHASASPLKSLYR